ncbi:MAG: S9 family peptidase [Bradymonadales bacterium]|nr:S9 family peptidase [Bradymonadales bacterium]
MRKSILILSLVLAACCGSRRAAFVPDSIETAPEPVFLTRVHVDYGEVPLIPRQVLFGNPTYRSASISPGGNRLAYLAPLDGVLNVWVRTVGQQDDHAITQDRGRGIQGYFWAYNNEQILYIQDQQGNENWRIYAVDVQGGEPRDLTPLEGVQARIQATDPKFPDEILVGLNDRDVQYHDLYRLNTRTGERRLLAVNDMGAAALVADNDWVVRIAEVPRPDGGFDVLYRSDPDSDWQLLFSWDSQDALTSGVIGFAQDNRRLYILSSAGTNTGELRLIDLASGEEQVLASDPAADISNALIHPGTREIQAVSFEKERTEWRVLDASIAADFEFLQELCEGDLFINNRDLADDTWLVGYTRDAGPVVYYAYRRSERQATFLFSSRPELEGLILATTEPISFTSRDGLTIRGYLTIPPFLEPVSLPTVLLVHGGPWYRDTWGYDPMVQWLANRGYAVLQVNFRGSTGYGKEFANAGDRQWGLAMQDDLTDGVEWLVSQGIADPRRVAIFGGSYGGFAVLSGLTRTPDLYACGVDIVGPSNLITLLQSFPPYWASMREMFHQRVGDPDQDVEFLQSISPLFHADRIRVPLLIGQGANDPRVAQAESEQIVAAMRSHGLPVTYLLYSDEGHGFVRPENRISFFAVAEAFLAQCLGGRYQPIEADFEGSTIEVVAGGDFLSL